jgi:cytochrome P450
MENLYVGLVNLFIGGSETTSNTLNWALYHLAKNPEIQGRVVAEIQAVVGQDRLPSLEDRPRTPLTEAVVLETHRMTGLAFSGIPRVVSKDTNLGGYFIPKVRISFAKGYRRDEEVDNF